MGITKDNRKTDCRPLQRRVVYVEYDDVQPGGSQAKRKTPLPSAKV